MRLDTEPDKTFIPIRWLTGPSLTCSGEHVGSLDFHPHLAVRRSSYLLPGVQRGLVESEYFHHLQAVRVLPPFCHGASGGYMENGTHTLLSQGGVNEGGVRSHR